MSDKIKNVFNNVWFVCVLTVAIFSGTFLLKTNEAKAVTQGTISGSCGIIFTANVNGWENVATHFGATMTNNAIGTIDFTNQTFGFKFNSVAPYGNTTHVDEVFESSSGAFTFVSFNSTTGIYEYKAVDSVDSNTIHHISVLPVNSSNTFLITAYTESTASATSPVSSGVCQKV